MKGMNYSQDRKIHVMSGKKTQISSTSAAASEIALTQTYQENRIYCGRGNLPSMTREVKRHLRDFSIFSKCI